MNINNKKRINCICDYSYDKDFILEITHYTEKIEQFIFSADDEDNIATWIDANMGEHINNVNGCPLFMELSSWASINAGQNEIEYTLNNYPTIDSSKWKIMLWNRSEE